MSALLRRAFVLQPHCRRTAPICLGKSHSAPRGRLYSSATNNDPDAPAVLSSVVPGTDALQQTFSMPDNPLGLYGLGGYSPVGALENLLAIFHYNFDCFWWSSIVGLTVLVKAAIFPVYLKQMRLSGNLAVHRPKIDEMNAVAQNMALRGQKAAAALERKRARDWMNANNVNPMKLLQYNLFIIPALISTFLAVRNLAASSVPSFVSEKCGWFVLSSPDPFCILPLISASAMMINFALVQKVTPITSNLFKYGVYGVSVLSVPITSTMASATVLYFSVLNCMTLLQTVALRLPFLRHHFNMPDVSKLVKKNSQTAKHAGSPWHRIKQSYKEYKVNQEQREKLAPFQKPAEPHRPPVILSKIGPSTNRPNNKLC